MDWSSECNYRHRQFVTRPELASSAVAARGNREHLRLPPGVCCLLLMALDDVMKLLLLPLLQLLMMAVMRLLLLLVSIRVLPFAYPV